MQLRIMRIAALHNTFYLADARSTFVVSAGSVQAGRDPKAGYPAKEATMDMTLRMNVLMAVLSFGLIAAIVLGMV